jgi:hypothetical protein
MSIVQGLIDTSSSICLSYNAMHRCVLYLSKGEILCVLGLLVWEEREVSWLATF